jgi:hypothetical protein
MRRREGDLSHVCVTRDSPNDILSKRTTGRNLHASQFLALFMATRGRPALWWLRWPFGRVCVQDGARPARLSPDCNRGGVRGPITILERRQNELTFPGISPELGSSQSHPPKAVRTPFARLESPVSVGAGFSAGVAGQ